MKSVKKNALAIVALIILLTVSCIAVGLADGPADGGWLTPFRAILILLVLVLAGLLVWIVYQPDDAPDWVEQMTDPADGIKTSAALADSAAEADEPADETAGEKPDAGD